MSGLISKKPKPMTDEERLEQTREMFPLNCAVKLSQHGIDLDRYKRERDLGIAIIGKVVGYSREPDCIWVLLDGRKTKIQWHRLFWERVNP